MYYSNYFYKEEFDECIEGYEPVSVKEMPRTYFDKMNFVDKHLAPTLRQARCSFKNIEYRLYRKGDNFSEIMVLYNSDENDGRYFFVNKDSEMGIMFDVMRNLI